MGIKFKGFRINSGFTLAEVIIVLGILGVIAVMTLPSLITNLNDTAFTKAKDLSLKKFTEATNQMKTNDLLSGYATTDAFVNNLQKYIKVARRCSSSNLNTCFSSSFTTGSTNQKVNISSLSTGADLGHDTYNSALVGLQLIDGTNIILAFDPACQRIAFWNNSTSTTSCVAMLYDINGFKAPNKIGKDIATLNATISVCDGAKIGSMCVLGGNAAPQSLNTCAGSPYDSQGASNTNCATNFWAGAKKACADAGNGARLPTITELTAIYNANNPSLGMTGYYWSSTEVTASAGMAQPFPFGSGMAVGSGKQSNMSIRCVQ